MWEVCGSEEEVRATEAAIATVPRVNPVTKTTALVFVFGIKTAPMSATNKSDTAMPPRVVFIIFKGKVPISIRIVIFRESALNGRNHIFPVKLTSRD